VGRHLAEEATLTVIPTQGGVVTGSDVLLRQTHDMSSHLNVEIKARCDDPAAMLQRLTHLGAVLQGVDRQVDTYFPAATGRLKLRTGNIENSLIHYLRQDSAGPKDSNATLIETRAEESADLRSLLAGALGIVVEVDKLRHILWIGNVKFHVDEVQGVGAFVEIEAIDRTGEIGRASLLTQCEQYLVLLGIAEADLEATSYSDLALANA